MKESVSNDRLATPMLFPYDPEQYWKLLREIIKEEIGTLHKRNSNAAAANVPELLNKPLYKMAEVCALFQVTKPTIYDWMKLGKLKPFKIRSRLFFHQQDIERLLHPSMAE
jgi:predicted DNA-binding transcriptional regulator AlpA